MTYRTCYRSNMTYRTYYISALTTSCQINTAKGLVNIESTRGGLQESNVEHRTWDEMEK